MTRDLRLKILQKERQKMAERYLEDGACPYCGESDEIEDEGKAEYVDEAKRRIVTWCKVCTGTWDAIYTLTEIKTDDLYERVFIGARR